MAGLGGVDTTGEWSRDAFAEVFPEIEDERFWDELREREPGVVLPASDLRFSIIERREFGREIPDGLVADPATFGFTSFDGVGAGPRNNFTIYFLMKIFWQKKST